MTYDRTYIGRANPALKGCKCRIINTWRRQGPHNVLIEFEGGRREIVPMRSIRKRLMGIIEPEELRVRQMPERK